MFLHLCLVLFQMTKNSPKFVEVVGAILITAGFLILGEPSKDRYKMIAILRIFNLKMIKANIKTCQLYFLTPPFLNSGEYTEASSMLTLFMSFILSQIHLDCARTIPVRKCYHHKSSSGFE